MDLRFHQDGVGLYASGKVCGALWVKDLDVHAKGDVWAQKKLITGISAQ